MYSETWKATANTEMKVSNNTISLRIIPISEKFLTTVGSSQCRNSQLARVQRIHDGGMLSPQWIAVSPPQRIRGHFGRVGKRECKSQGVGKQQKEVFWMWDGRFACEVMAAAVIWKGWTCQSSITGRRASPAVLPLPETESFSSVV